jgi:hypothetical protein
MNVNIEYYKYQSRETGGSGSRSSLKPDDLDRRLVERPWEESPPRAYDEASTLEWIARRRFAHAPRGEP